MYAQVLNLLILFVRPQSRGTISLKSSDPFDAPIIDPKQVY